MVEFVCCSVWLWFFVVVMFALHERWRNALRHFNCYFQMILRVTACQSTSTLCLRQTVITDNRRTNRKNDSQWWLGLLCRILSRRRCHVRLISHERWDQMATISSVMRISHQFYTNWTQHRVGCYYSTAAASGAAADERWGHALWR